MPYLTILIPTYNRKDSLISLLKSIESQGHFGEYCIVLSDNCSNYNLDEVIKSSFPEEFIHNIRINSWAFNTGMGTNLAISFLLVESEWCWFLSDDDEIAPNALDVILNDCKRLNDCIAVKHSVEKIAIHKDNYFYDIDNYLDYYLNSKLSDRIYMNMLFHIRLLKPFLGSLTANSYTNIPFIFPVLLALNDKIGAIFTSSEVLYKYTEETGNCWASQPTKFLDVALGIRSSFDSQHGFSKNTFLKYKEMISGAILSARTLSRRIIVIDSQSERKRYYYLLRSYFTGSQMEVLLYKIICRISILFNISSTRIEKIIKIILH